jgi:hypothetical protein
MALSLFCSVNTFIQSSKAAFPARLDSLSHITSFGKKLPLLPLNHATQVIGPFMGENLRIEIDVTA